MEQDIKEIVVDVVNELITELPKGDKGDKGDRGDRIEKLEVLQKFLEQDDTKRLKELEEKVLKLQALIKQT